MTKLLIVTTIEGTLRAFLLPFAQHFRSQGWQVDAMALRVSKHPECLSSFDKVWEIEWSRNPLDPRNFLAAPQVIKKAMAEEKYDIIHVHTPVAGFVSRAALNDFRKQGKCKVIYTAHGFHFHPGGSQFKNAIYLNLEKLAGPWTDYLVTINREDEAAAKKHHFLPSDRIRYMPGIGVDLDYYNPDLVSEAEVARVRQDLGLTKETPLFLTVAELIPRKRHRDVIQAFGALNRPEVHLALAGPSTTSVKEEMQQLASDLGVKERVHFLGMRRDIPILMRASLATILVSEQEGLARCVLESLSMEIPVIGTKIRGIQELVEDECGLLVEVGDIPGITRAMAWVLDHPDELKKMGQNGRLKMQKYQIKQITKLHEDLYAEALSR
ncbi:MULTISPECIES: glycosyltransferase family 4 protein [unclassified Microcoleus]|uniref:glycosyltransferase family 4 protein n=1 Tax=unclassified Microcoleus TaxID=2642155 RepID=UPI002FD36E0F